MLNFCRCWCVLALSILDLHNLTQLAEVLLVRVDEKLLILVDKLSFEESHVS